MAFMVMVLAGTNGIPTGNLYWMATRTISPGEFAFVPVGAVLQAGGVELVGPHQLAVTVIALAVIPGYARPVT